MNFEGLVIDRPLMAVFQDSNDDLICALNDFSNLSLNTSAETKDKTNAAGALLKRFYTAKNLEISAESATFSFNLAGMQFGNGVEVASEDGKISLPKIIQIAKAASFELPDAPIEGTLAVYGCTASGIPDINKKYTLSTEAGAGVYALSENTLTLPTDAADMIQIQYEYETAVGVKVVNYADKFPKTCKATFQVLVSETCDDTLRLAYIVVPRFQMAPDFDWTVDTESTHAFSGTAQADVCSKTKQLCYVAMSDNDVQ